MFAASFSRLSVFVVSYVFGYAFSFMSSSSLPVMIFFPANASCFVFIHIAQSRPMINFMQKQLLKAPASTF